MLKRSEVDGWAIFNEQWSNRRRVLFSTLSSHRALSQAPLCLTCYHMEENAFPVYFESHKDLYAVLPPPNLLKMELIEPETHSVHHLPFVSVPCVSKSQQQTVRSGKYASNFPQGDSKLPLNGLQPDHQRPLLPHKEDLLIQPVLLAGHEL